MGTNALSFEEKLNRFNTVVLAGLVPASDIMGYNRAKALMATTKMEHYFGLYLGQYKKAQEVLGITPTESAPDSQVVEEESTAPPTPDAHRAKLAYKKLSNTLKYKLFKEEYLLEKNHTCVCCGTTFPTRSQYKDESPSDTYPLYVRCTLPVVKYIEKRRLFEVKDLLSDQMLFNPAYYVAICDGCQPMRFKK